MRKFVVATALLLPIFCGAPAMAGNVPPTDKSGSWVSMEDYTDSALRPTPVVTDASQTMEEESVKAGKWTDLLHPSKEHPETAANTAPAIRFASLPGKGLKPAPVRAATTKNRVPHPAPVSVAQAPQASCTAAETVAKEGVKTAKPATAMESDSHTLLALQRVVAEMGLQKKLNFVESHGVTITAPVSASN